MTDRIPPSGPTASPFRLNLEQQRKRAKELHRALLAGGGEALARFRRHHPRGDQLSEAAAVSPAGLSLADAQCIVARELGLPSWPKLKAHIEAETVARARLAGGAGARDADCPTLHLRCGSDIEQGLRQAGLAGAFLEYSDPFCQGPVVAERDWLERRAEFLAAAYGEPLARPRGELLARLREEERRLLEAAERYRRVVLWFEHDSYDQLILARCLAAFAERAPERLEMVTLDRYPGGVRFLGLGQLPPESLLLLWEARRPVTAAQLAEGREIWHRLRLSDPRPLAAAAGAGSLPFMAPALRRHCQELPWRGDGLSLSERLILRTLASGPLRVGELYRDLMLTHEPLPWMGDLMLLEPLARLRQGPQAALVLAAEARPEQPFQERLGLTPLGRALLAGDADWMAEPRPPRWVGGVPLGPG